RRCHIAERHHDAGDAAIARPAPPGTVEGKAVRHDEAGGSEAAEKERHGGGMNQSGQMVGGRDARGEARPGLTGKVLAMMKNPPQSMANRGTQTDPLPERSTKRRPRAKQSKNTPHARMLTLLIQP